MPNNNQFIIDTLKKYKETTQDDDIREIVSELITRLEGKTYSIVHVFVAAIICDKFNKKIDIPSCDFEIKYAINEAMEGTKNEERSNNDT